MDSEKFDAFLNENHTISKEMLDSMDYAYNYDAASTINWLQKRILNINELVQKNICIKVEDKTLILIRNYEDLKHWVQNRYNDLQII